MKQKHEEFSRQLSTDELLSVQGGIWPGLLLEGIGLLISEWETTKKAARDAWAGNYDPPTL